MSLRASWASLALSFVLACGPDAKNVAGKLCSSDDDCAGLTCVADANGSEADLEPAPLVCGKPSSGRDSGAACDRGSQCALGVCLLAGACAAPCATDQQCAKNERCAPVYARTNGDALQTLQACVARVDLPSDADIVSEVQKQALHGKLDTIDLPAVQAPTLFVFEHLNDTQWPLSNSACRPPLCAPKLVTRDAPAHVLFDLATIDSAKDGPDNPIANGDYVNPVTVLLPNSPRSVLSNAGYALTLQDQEPGDLRVTRLHRDTRGHQLDLNLFYVGARGLTAMRDRGPAFVADALAEVDTVLGQADIFIGDVRQIEVTGELLQKGTPIPAVTVAKGFSTIGLQYGVYPELPELWKLSAGAADVALDVFFVADIAPGSAGGDVGGISGGTPGPLGMHGTPGSGIAISTDMMLDAGDPKSLGRTLAHEIGHMLGLFHTSEITGVVFDPLPDTPVCGPDQDSNADGQLSADECIGFGADNLMFPTEQMNATKLTEQQREILRSAIVLH